MLSARSLSIVRRLAAAGLAVLLALAAAALLAPMSGAEPMRAVRALLDGSVASASGLAATVVGAVPLLLTGLAVMLAFRSGVFNIGAEGQFLIGALAATAAGTQIGPLPGQALLVLIVGAFAGAAWATIAALFREYRQVSEVITTILLNFVALYLVSYSVAGPLQEQAATYPQSDPLASSATLWRLVPGTRLHAGILVALAMAVAAGALLSRTTLGLRLRAAGLNADAARLAGFPVGRDLFLAFALSGGLAGLAGAIEVTGVTGRLYERISPGYGYAAIAIALLGGLSPVGVIAAALFFASLGTGAAAMERSAGVSAVLALAVQGATLLAVAATTGMRWTGLVEARAKKDGPGVVHAD